MGIQGSIHKLLVLDSSRSLSCLPAHCLYSNAHLFISHLANDFCISLPLSALHFLCLTEGTSLGGDHVIPLLKILGQWLLTEVKQSLILKISTLWHPTK